MKNPLVSLALTASLVVTAATNNPGVTVVKGVPAGFDTVTLRVPKSPDPKKFARLKAAIAP